MQLFSLLYLISVVSAGNVVAYWGQNAGGSQQQLLSYCNDDSVDILVLSFMNNFPQVSLDFSNMCLGQFSSGLLHCTQISQDIKTCQQNGKKILLSLGGATGSYGFQSDSDAQQFATTLWNKFGGGQDSQRPFDDAVVDGFDFDIENKDQTGYPALANALRSHFLQDLSKQYYISAAPQCVYPDESVGDLLLQTQVDFAFIQFYNNYCSLDKSFNFDTWEKFAQSSSPNKNIKLYVGLPGSSASAGSGYVDASTVQQQYASFSSSPNFGGFSVWDVSSADGSGFLQQLKGILANSGSASAANTPAASSQDPISASETPTSSSAVGAYTTLAPAYSVYGGTSTVTDVQTTILTITSCSDNACSQATIQTGVTTVQDETTSYVTYCPLTAEAAEETASWETSAPAEVPNAATPNALVSPTSAAPVSAAPVVTTVLASPSVIENDYSTTTSTILLKTTVTLLESSSSTQATTLAAAATTVQPSALLQGPYSPIVALASAAAPQTVTVTQSETATVTANVTQSETVTVTANVTVTASVTATVTASQIVLVTVTATAQCEAPSSVSFAASSSAAPSAAKSAAGLVKEAGIASLVSTVTPKALSTSSAATTLAPAATTISSSQAPSVVRLALVSEAGGSAQKASILVLGLSLLAALV